MALFLSDCWAPLLKDLACRNPAFRPPPPTSDDPKDILASRANRLVLRNLDVGAASAALRAPPRPAQAAPGQVTATFRALNPQAGEDAPPIPLDPSLSFLGGGDTEAHFQRQATREDRQAAGFILGGVTRRVEPRRELRPPNFQPPPPISFTVDQIISKVRRASTSSAGGPSGTDYKTLRSWFAEKDEISENATSVINLIAAGRVPEPIKSLLIAGRGVVILKNEKGDLRPIVVGNILLRLIGSVAVHHLSADFQKFFL